MQHGLETTAIHNASVQRFNHELPFLDLGTTESYAEHANQQCWSLLCAMICNALNEQAEHLFIEPDAMFWRIRTRRVDGYSEEILHDSSALQTALNLLQTLLWGKDYFTKPNRKARFLLQIEGAEQALGLTVLSTAKGDYYEFSLSLSETIPPILEQLNLDPTQLRSFRELLALKTGLIVLAGPEPAHLLRTMQAMVQDVISPDRRMLFIAPEHEHSLPRTAQIESHCLNQQHSNENWLHALDQHADTVMLSGTVPQGVYRQLNELATHKALLVQAIEASSIKSVMDLQQQGAQESQHLYAQMRALIVQYPVRTLCKHCKSPAILTEQEKTWLDQIRTPASENVISWLTDGNTERYLMPVGCSRCADTGYSGSQSVFHIIQNPISKLHFMHSRGSADGVAYRQSAINPLLKQLMGMVNGGEVPLREAMRVISLN